MTPTELSASWIQQWGRQELGPFSTSIHEDHERILDKARHLCSNASHPVPSHLGVSLGGFDTAAGINNNEAVHYLIQLRWGFQRHRVISWRPDWPIGADRGSHVCQRPKGACPGRAAIKATSDTSRGTVIRRESFAEE